MPRTAINGCLEASGPLLFVSPLTEKPVSASSNDRMTDADDESGSLKISIVATS